MDCNDIFFINMKPRYLNVSGSWELTENFSFNTLIIDRVDRASLDKIVNMTS